MQLMATSMNLLFWRCEPNYACTYDNAEEEEEYHDDDDCSYVHHGHDNNNITACISLGVYTCLRSRACRQHDVG